MKHPRVAFVLAILPAAILACGADAVYFSTSFYPYSVTAVGVLSTGSPGSDEDPTVVFGLDGRLHVVWFSDRGGNSDLYASQSSDGITWSPPVRITTDPAGDFAPSLIQDETGVFHLAWFRWTAPFRGHIRYSRSIDGMTWNPADDVQVTTTPDVDDWVPTLVRTPDGALRIVFVSDLRDPANPSNVLYMTRKLRTDASWSAPIPLPGVDSPTESDHLPFAALIGGTIHLTWVRHAASQPLPWLATKSEVMHATSTDGETWSVPTQVTQDPGNVVQIFPSLHERFDGTWSLAWLSTRTGSAVLHAIPLAEIGNWPAGITAFPELSPGYSHRIVKTSAPGVYAAFWVSGPVGAEDISYRLFAGP